MRPRGAPLLVARLVFESDGPTLHIVADTDEDERRLDAWITENPALILDMAAALYRFLSGLLDEAEARGGL